MASAVRNARIFLVVFWIGGWLEKCDGICDVKFNKIKCFVDDQNEPRPLPLLLSSDRDGSSEHSIGWGNWDEYIDDVICRCAKKAAKNGYPYFGLQFYGECWSGRGAAATFARAGTSRHCITKEFEKCSDRSKKPCVGESHTNFVYMVSSHDNICDVKYTKDGCYNNNQGEPHAFPVMLFTDNVSSSPKYSNVSTGFSKWRSYVVDLACRCAAKARERSYTRFSLQNFGECWSGPDLESVAVADERGQAGNCIGQSFLPCAPKDQVCVGKKSANFVYDITTE